MTGQRLVAATGISKSEVSRTCAELDGDLEARRTFPFNGGVPYALVLVGAITSGSGVRHRVGSAAVVVCTVVHADPCATRPRAAFEVS